MNKRCREILGKLAVGAEVRGPGRMKWKRPLGGATVSERDQGGRPDGLQSKVTVGQ